MTQEQSITQLDQQSALTAIAQEFGVDPNEVQLATQQEPSVVTEQPSQVITEDTQAIMQNVQPIAEQSSMVLESPFEDDTKQAPAQYNYPMDPAMLQGMIEQAAQRQVNQILQQKQQQSVGSKVTEGQEPAQENKALSDEDIRKAIREEMENAQMYQQIQQANYQAAVNYESKLKENLGKIGVDLQKDEMLNYYVKNEYNAAIERARDYVRNEFNRDLMPDDIKEVNKWHFQRVQQMVGAKTPQQPQVKPQQTLSPMNNAVNTPAAKPTSSVAEVERKYADAAAKGTLSPSQRVAYVRALAQLQGKSEIKF